jgi:transcriptional regulator with XRE-family HTH domain
MTLIQALSSTYGDRVADDEPGRRFAQLLRSRRAELGLRQEDIAEKSGVSLSTIQRWEAGNVRNPDPAQVQAVCRVLGIRTVDAAVALGYVAAEDTEPAPPPPIRSPALQELIDMFEDPAVPESMKREALNYLRYLRSQPPPETGTSRAAS